jgi:hypothetical protein
VGSSLPAIISGLGVALLTSSAAFADVGADQSAAAEALFRSGRDLMAAGKIVEACPKFAESQRMDPKLGTLMNLALCHDKAGKTASAWAEYTQAAEIAKRVGQADREKVASDRAHALEPSLVHVIIDATDAPGQAVTLDQRTIGPGAFGTAVPVDPGDHEVRVTAPGKKTFLQSFKMDPQAGDRTIRVPLLDAGEPGGAPAAGPAQAAPANAQPSLAASPETPGGSGSRTLGLVVGGAGVVVTGVGLIFGLEAMSQKQTANKECNSTYCTQDGLNAISSMHAFEAASTLTVAAGLVGVGAGVYFFLAGGPKHGASDRQAASWRVVPDVVARGAKLQVDF